MASVLCVSVVAGCSTEYVDLCEAMDLEPNQRCVTLHVAGDFDPVDNVQLDVIYQALETADYSIRRVVSRPLGDSSAAPFAIGLVFPPRTVPGNAHVLARAGTVPVAYARYSFYIPGLRQEVTLASVANDTCFDGIKETDELAVDCSGWNGSCPFCVPGDPCERDLDCVSSTCVGYDPPKRGICVAAP